MLTIATLSTQSQRGRMPKTSHGLPSGHLTRYHSGVSTKTNHIDFFGFGESKNMSPFFSRRQKKQFAKRDSNLKKLVAELKLTKPSELIYFLEKVARNLGDHN